MTRFLLGGSVKTQIASCVDCGYPIGISKIGQEVSCPMCGITQESISGITQEPIGTSAAIWVIAGCAVLGVLLGVSRCRR